MTDWKFCSKLSEIINHITGGPKGFSLCARWYLSHKMGKRSGTIMVILMNKLTRDEYHCVESYVWRLIETNRKGKP